MSTTRVYRDSDVARTLRQTIPFDAGSAILFLRETGVKGSTNGAMPEKRSVLSNITGEDAKRFYEDILSHVQSSGQQTSEGTKSHTRTKKFRQASVGKTAVRYSLAKLFLAAQEGNLPSIKTDVSEKQYDVNSVDEFGWTLLMVAAHAGHAHVVEYLLSEGAEWENRKDKKGNNAVDLATKGGHPLLANKILQHGQQASISEETGVPRTSATTNEALYCEVCKLHVPAARHSTSVVHQFSCQHHTNVTSYGIPVTNRGFQLLLKKGWDRERGLGAEGQGLKYPIRTILKHDRLGLGLRGSAKPRVTHFQPYDVDAVRPHNQRKGLSGGSVSPQSSVGKRRDTREWEIRLRRYMNSDD